jgi:tetratricopeptide (TPR) repeat protein
MSWWNLFGSNKIREYEARVEREPDDPQWRFDLAAEYDRRGQFPRAIEAFHETLKLSPRSAEAHFNLGILYEKTQNGRQAIFHMVQAGNLFSERNDSENKDKARTKLRSLYNKFDSVSGVPPNPNHD